VNTVREGLDYATLIRFFLWDKVPRALRKQSDPEGFRFEEQLLANRQVSLARPSLALTEWLKRPIRPLYRLRDKVRLRLQAGQNPVLYAPYRHDRLKASLQALSQDNDLTIATPYIRSPQYQAGLPLHLPRRGMNLADRDYATALHAGVIQGLQQQGITLLPQDQDWLGLQIFHQLGHIRQVEAELAHVQPQAILVFSDNHYPMQEYVHVANRAGIPTIMLQHGLDCEHYCLEDAYASVIAVWGEARRQRYQHHSVPQPDRIQVTGNPEYDAIQLPETLNTHGDYWLWVSRPHHPDKCFSPSRHPQEGVMILEALLQAVQRSPETRLLIKPHPYDYTELYRTLVECHQLSDRVSITTDRVSSLLPQASLVLSEDSTAGLEAMFAGKILIHVHFAPSPPTLPFVAYQAALPAYSPDMLKEALQQATQLTAIELQQMQQGQRQFIQDYAGPCDGQAHRRVLELIRDVVSTWRNKRCA
jgi:hypothetical protein